VDEVDRKQGIERERGEDMQQRATGQTRTWDGCGRVQSLHTWAKDPPAHPSELKRTLTTFISCSKLSLFVRVFRNA